MVANNKSMNSDSSDDEFELIELLLQEQCPNSFSPSTFSSNTRSTMKRRVIGLESSATLKQRSTLSLQSSNVLSNTFDNEPSSNLPSSSTGGHSQRRKVSLLLPVVLLLGSLLCWEWNTTIEHSHQEPGKSFLADLNQDNHQNLQKQMEPASPPIELNHRREFLRKLEADKVNVPRTALKPTKYTDPNPSIILPSNLNTFLADITQPLAANDVPLFWHILKSGGTTTKDSIGSCLGKTEASESGVLDGHISDRELRRVHIMNGNINYVNVDTTNSAGIQRAISMGLVESQMADVIFSPLLHESSLLFNNTNYRARSFCLFRHPMERAVSLFHYLKRATWEPTFSKKLEAIKTVEDYAISEFAENNWMVRFLTNEMSGIVTRNHLALAKEILRRKVVVGLTADMEHSFHRFIKYFQWDKSPLSVDQQTCLKNYLSNGSNRNKHVLEAENTIGWRILRSNNLLDLELYEYVLQLYEEQGRVLGIA